MDLPDMQSGPDVVVHEYQSPGKAASLETGEERGAPVSHEIEQDDVILEPLSPRPYELTYACLIIPRFSTHTLEGDLVKDLQGWMVRVCVSFNWRLEALEIQPGYMQWLLSVPAAVPPVHFMRLIRVHTSRGLLTEYPRFRRENVSTDFWAPGHLVIVGSRPHSPRMISEFIRLTRQHQGIPTDPRR